MECIRHEVFCIIYDSVIRENSMERLAFFITLMGRFAPYLTRSTSFKRIANATFSLLVSMLTSRTTRTSPKPDVIMQILLNSLSILSFSPENRKPFCPPFLDFAYQWISSGKPSLQHMASTLFQEFARSGQTQEDQREMHTIVRGFLEAQPFLTLVRRERNEAGLITFFAPFAANLASRNKLSHSDILSMWDEASDERHPLRPAFQSFLAGIVDALTDDTLTKFVSAIV
jgi:hypothetical protein